MIINIRGTSGSGKSTLMRRIMEHPDYGRRLKYHIDGRKQPIGYVLQRLHGNDLAIIGHYETACGGCDTIQKMEEIFRLVRESHAAGHDVMFEGLLISADVNRAQALHDDGLPFTVIALDKVPLETCLDSVNQRRNNADEARIKKVQKENYEKTLQYKKKDKAPKLKPVPQPRGPVNPVNTTSKFRGVQLSMKRLTDAGVEVHSCDRELAYTTICKTLELEPVNG